MFSQTILTSWNKSKKRGKNENKKVYPNSNEIISLDGQDNVGIEPCPKFNSNVDFDNFIRNKFLGIGKSYIFSQWTENALELGKHLDLPGFFKTWLDSQNEYKGSSGPAKKLEKQI